MTMIPKRVMLGEIAEGHGTRAGREKEGPGAMYFGIISGMRQEGWTVAALEEGD